VTTRVGGAESAVTDARFLTSVDDENRLAEAARSLLIDRDLAGSAGSAGSARALAEFNLEHVASDINVIYRTPLERKSSPYGP
jgi:hypothetical protein